MVHVKSIIESIAYLFLLFLIDLILQSLYFGAVTNDSTYVTVFMWAIMMVALEVLVMAPLLHHFGKLSDTFGFSKLTKSDISKTLTYLLVMLFGEVVLNLIQQMVNHGHVVTSENQASLMSLATPKMIFGVVVLTLFIAPIIEETMFRGVLIGIGIPNFSNWAKILISGMMFGAFHVMLQAFQWFAFIQYSYMGAVLAYAYVKNNRLQSSMMLHFSNNLIATIPLVLLAFK